MLLSDKYPFLTNYFTQTITQNEGGLQSVLFYGSDFESQYILAKEIARLLNCTGDSSDNCECMNCKWIRNNTHPAVMTISKIDNKPDDDDSKNVISIKQSALIKESLINSSEFHRVFIFCDKNEDGSVGGVNQLNFQAEAANSLLKIIEEPQPGVTFIFLTRYIDDVLSTIVSRSQCFFVPSYMPVDYDYSVIAGVFDNYWNFSRKDVFDISQNLQNLTQEHSILTVLESIQNYMLYIFKNNPHNNDFIRHIKIIEQSKKMAKLGIKPANIFDDICLKIIK